MHHALEIQEILFNIFEHCYPPNTPSEDSNLASLARTCRTFKEPALDVLWERLDILSPLARCLPEASYVSSPDEQKYFREYSFSRSPCQSEWDTLRSYMRRIKSISIQDSLYGLDWDSIRTLLKPPAAEPVFPNVRYLYFEYTFEAIPMLRFPFPSLMSLDIELHNPRFFEDSLKSFANIAPNLTKLSIYSYRYARFDMGKIDPNFICQWRKLQAVDCYEIFLDVNTLLYLSRMSALTRLNFSLSSELPGQISPSDLPLLLPNLRHFSLESASLPSISTFLSQSRLPAVTEFYASLESCPSNKNVSFFWTSLQTSGIGDVIQKLWFSQRRTYGPVSVDLLPVLGLEDLQPCMVFTNLRDIHFDVKWRVVLADNELLTLASAWPHLEGFVINMEWGWRTRGGITPDGLTKFLRKCPSLNRIGLAIDTRGYTELSQPPATLGSTLPQVSKIDVLDSYIEEESVPAIAAFFAGIVPRPEFSFSAWLLSRTEGSLDRVMCKPRWEEVHRRIKDIVGQHS